MQAAIRYLDLEIPAPARTRVQVAPGVHWLRFPLPFALDHINLWLLEDGEHWTLVDTGIGLDDIRSLWNQALRECLDGRPLSRIIVTHYHPDHIGQAAWLSERFQVPVLMTQGEAATAWRIHQTGSQISGRKLANFFTTHGLDTDRVRRLAAQGNRYRHLVPELPVVLTPIRDGQIIEIGGHAWRVMVGHGHSPEHAALFCPELAVLISGDQLLPSISTNISVGPADPEGDPLAAYLDSLESLAMLPPAVRVLPSHGVVFEGLHARIGQLQAHHQQRLEWLRRACREARSAAEVLDILFARSLDTHQLVFAMGEAIAHLNRLYAAGEAERIPGVDGILRYRCSLFLAS